MSDSPSHSSEYSYSYSYTPSDGDEEELPLMWRQITRIPVDALWKTDDFSYMNKVLDLTARYDFSEYDVHLSDPKLTVLVGSILKLVATKCSEKIKVQQNQCATSESECSLLKDKIMLQNKEVTRLRSQLDAALQASTSNNAAALQSVQADARLADARSENDELQLKLRRASREIEELKQKVATRDESVRQTTEYYTKMQKEYSHLVTQFAKEKDRHGDMDRLLRKLAEAETQRRHTEETRKRLELEMGVLRHDKKRLEESLHKAEDSLQVLKRDTLNDMDRAQSLMRKKDEFWEQKTGQLQQQLVEFENQKEDLQRTIADLERELDDCKTDVVRLQQRAQSPGADRPDIKSDSESQSTASSDGSSGRGGAAPLQQRRVIDRLERENDNLLDAVRKLEAQNASIEDEKRNLRQILNQYEEQDSGLGELRRQVEHLHGVKSNLEQEVTQLKQRLNSATDTLAYTKALEELCRGLGVTKEELNSLKPQNSVAYNEVDTLREEVNVLKEEVEWLEKERRHWMDKVRLQPLMDTKLRLQLGLTAEQLRQLDDLVEQMRMGADIVEDTEDGNFRAKYFQQLEARRKDAEQFNEFVKKRIDEAISQAFHGVVAPEAASAVSALKDHIDVITSNNRVPSDAFFGTSSTTPGLTPGSAGGVATADVRQLQSQVQSLTRRVEQSELSLKDRESTIGSLKERLAVISAERELITKERDQYRDAIFDAAGVVSRDTEGGTQVEEDDRSASSIGRDKDQSLPSDAATGPFRMSANKWATISATLREQLSSKDTLIATLAERMTQAQKAEEAHHNTVSELEGTLATEKRERELLVDQIAALNAAHEDLLAQVHSLQKLNKDLRDASHVDERELLQKVVLLRRREAHLLQRLHRAQVANLEASDVEKSLRQSMASTLQALKEQLAGSAGYVLPPSTTQHCAEQEMLSHLHDSISGILSGKLFREDTRFIAQLQRVYHCIETNQEMAESRAACRLKERELEDLQRQIDTLKSSPAPGGATSTSPLSPGNAPSSSDAHKWESEATTWRQKYTLCSKRLDDKEKEVELLEKDLDDARAEVLEMREHLRGGGSSPPSGDDGAPTAPVTSATPPPTPVTRNSSNRTRSALHISRLERDVARLKSVNLSLIQLSFDLQSRVKAVEVDLEGRDQELALIKDSGSARIVSDFVSAAIREHAALRRQSELALIQVKRLKVQLAASEANYHVVANEATSYKLNAYRLYRRYADETVATVDYLRCHQRTLGGAMSARRVQAMATRFNALASDVDASFRRNKLLATQLSDEVSAVVTLEQQMSLLKADTKQNRDDLLDTRLKEARLAARDAARRLVECKEDCKHAESRASRLEEHVKQLDAELARLEFDAPNLAVLSDQIVEKLRALQDSILQPPDTNTYLTLSAAPRHARDVHAMSDVGESDVAIREYKAAVVRQMELATQCDRLKEELDQRNAECRKQAATISELRDETARLENCATEYQMQMEAERKKAETREARLILAHDKQANVSRRATEHNVACLQDLLQKKEAAITSLEEQLQFERRKYVEHQYEEAARMEKLHENMFRENSAMVDRFKEAIGGVSDTLTLGGHPDPTEAAGTAGSGSAEHTVNAQLQALTAETIRLRSELKRARSSNVVLEAQLAQRISEAQNEAGLGIPTVDQLLAPQLGNTTHSDGWPTPGMNTANPAAGPSSSAEVLSGIIQYQNAMISSLREREMSLTEEAQRESLRRSQLEQQLNSLQERHIEQGGTLDLLARATGVTAAGDSPLVQELRAQLAQAEQQLRMAKEQLSSERHAAKRLQVDAEEWRSHLSTLQTEVTAQQIEVERSKQLAALNQSLREDINAVKEQNDKLVLAASTLKHKLLDEVAHGGDAKRQRQQEVALAQRMGVIQQESAAQLRVLERRLRSVQKELDAHVEKEKAMLHTNEESQRLAYRLHHELRCKDKEIAELQEAAASTHGTSGAAGRPATAPRATAATAEAGTQVLPTVATRGSAEGCTDQTGHWDQKENLQQISLLRSQSTRLEKDLRDSREQLAAEREATRSLRMQIQSMKQQRDEMEATHARELVRLHRHGAASVDVALPATHSTDEASQPLAAAAQDERRSATQSTMDVYARHLEAENDALRKQLTVVTAGRVNELEHRVSRQNDVLRRIAADVAATQGITVTEVLQRYEITTGVTKTVEDLESQLLQKNNELLDLRFTKETLQLRVHRLERQLQELSTTTSRPGAAGDALTEKRNLETVVENLRVVIEHLQRENRNLAAQACGHERYKQLLHEVLELRDVATSLAADNARLEKSAATGRHHPSGSARPETDSLLRRLAAAQATARQYESELSQSQQKIASTTVGTRGGDGAFTHTSETRLEDDVEQLNTVPPPLPAAPFSQTASIASSPSAHTRVRTSPASAAPLQRRLSTNAASLSSARHSDLPHHHQHTRQRK